MIEILTTISLIAGGVLFLLLVLSLLGGFDLDVDFDFDLDGDADGGLGYVKGGLTFVSAGAWVAKLILQTSDNPTVAFLSGAAVGAVAVFLLHKMIKFMMAQEANVNYRPEDALFQPGKVYLRIPAGGDGLVNVDVKGRKREFKARTADQREIPTGTPIEVVELNPDGSVLVQPIPAPA